jgi:DNA-binding GntR family transcriptional regulator
MCGVDGNAEQIARPEPLRTSVYRRVVRLMTGGELEPGETVTEAGLSKSLGVSRTPVREALLQLEAEGVLQSTPAKGFAVRELSRAEATELYPILANLEALAVRLATPRPDTAELQQLDEGLEEHTDPVVRWRIDTAFHEKLIENCPNANLRILITRLRVTLSRYEIEYLRRAGGTWKHTDGNRHAAIVNAIAKNDLDGTNLAIESNWQASLDAVQTWLARPNSR